MSEKIVILSRILKPSLDALVLTVPKAEFNNNMGQILALTLSAEGGTKGIVGTEYGIFKLLWTCKSLFFILSLVLCLK